MHISTSSILSFLNNADTKDLQKTINDANRNDSKNLVDKLVPVEKQVKQQVISDLLNSLFKKATKEISAKPEISKELAQSDIAKVAKNATKEISELIKLVKKDIVSSKFSPALEKVLLHVKDLSAQNIKPQLEKSGVFLEAKLGKTSVDNFPANIKENLNTLLKLLKIENPKVNQEFIKNIDKIQEIPKVNEAFTQKLDLLIKNAKNIDILNAPTKKQIALLQEVVSGKSIPELEKVKYTIKEMLLDIKTATKKDISAKISQNDLLQKINIAPKADKNFISDIKSLVNTLKSENIPNKPIIQLVAKLQDLSIKSALIASKIANGEKIPTAEMKKVEIPIKELLNNISALIKDTKVEPALKNISKELDAVVTQTLNVPEFFPKELPKATLSEQLQRIVNLIKTELLTIDKKAPDRLQIQKAVNELETNIKTAINEKQIVPNQKLISDVVPKDEIAKDMKAILLNVKKSISDQTSPIAKDINIHVDKILQKIDYFQLYSFANDTSSTYLPFSWDSLDGGQISLKKLKQNRFFCEINLSLKEYGKIDLMIMLHEDVHVNISVFAEKKEFNILVKEHLKELKVGLNNLGLISENINLFDALKDKKLKEDTRNFASSIQLGSGLNIEV